MQRQEHAVTTVQPKYFIQQLILMESQRHNKFDVLDHEMHAKLE